MKESGLGFGLVIVSFTSTLPGDLITVLVVRYSIWFIVVPICFMYSKFIYNFNKFKEATFHALGNHDVLFGPAYVPAGISSQLK